MTTNKERAVEVIGGVIDRLTTDRSGVPVATRITQALADAGLLMPDLSEPSRDMVSPAGKVWYSNGPLSDIRATSDGIVAFGSWKETPFRVQLTADQAEELAGILWAAARHHAEQEQGNA